MTICSADALAAGEPLPGTAPVAPAWIVIEQPGPWGRDALQDSRLDPAIARHLAGAKSAGVSVVLARHPDRQRTFSSDRHVWIAFSGQQGTLLRHAVLDDIVSLATWDLEAIGSGHLPHVGDVESDPMLFVCSQSGRDRCCAVQGRALMDALLAIAPPSQRMRVWECSHVGGHRFAPVTLTLPTGAVHGRLDPAEGRALLEATARGEVLVGSLRGFSSQSAPAQAAVIEVLQTAGMASLDDLVIVDPRPDAGADAVVVEVRHRDGRTWRIPLQRTDLGRNRVESCGKDPVPGIVWTPTLPC